MPLETIPVLAQDFPVFDWSQYQSSRDALVKDHPVADFRKETWNAIVDKLNDALRAAGMEWDNAYTTILGASVNEAYGALEAEMFNSLRYNIDQATPIGWRWANDPTFRGYVGRDDFRGYRWHGMDCDFVYPEYIIELVRKLNLMIDIMKDNANISSAAHQSDSPTLLISGLLAKQSAPMAHESDSASIFLQGLIRKPSKPIAGESKSASIFLQGLIRKPSRPIIPEVEKCKAETLHESTLIQKRVTPFGSYWDLMNTLSEAEMDVWKSLHITPGVGMAESSGAGQVADVPSFPVIGSGVSKSTQDVDVTAAESSPIQATGLGNTIHKGEILPREPFGVVGADKSTTQHSATPDGLVPFGGGGKEKSASDSTAQMDSAWFPPVWVNGGLWIRQAYGVTQNDDGSLGVV
jgi:hypothetical protein